MSDLGYKCGCGKFHTAGGWGAAHWDEVLVHTCDECGAKNTIKRGNRLKSVKPKKLKG
jgi:hypothetical protein